MWLYATPEVTVFKHTIISERQLSFSAGQYIFYLIGSVRTLEFAQDELFGGFILKLVFMRFYILRWFHTLKVVVPCCHEARILHIQTSAFIDTDFAYVP